MKYPLSLTLSLSSYLIRNRLSGNQRVPLVLMLEPLHACNLHCAGCGRIREYHETIKEQMSLGDCLASVEECGAPIVSICGGEPLIYPEIDTLVDELIRRKKHVYLCTNGYYLRRSLSKFKPSSYLLLNMHIDGPEEIHDQIVGKKGVFQEALAGIAEARKRGFLVTTNTTLCRQTSLEQIDGLFRLLYDAGVRGFLISPAYSYDTVEDRDFFMTRDEIRTQFAEAWRRLRRYPLSNTPIYMEFLRGERELPCTAWGNPTRNPLGWRSPCYLLMDRHYATFAELMQETDWSAYGPGHDPRCANCMVHCGFEPSVALGLGQRRGDFLKLAVWHLI